MPMPDINKRIKAVVFDLDDTLVSEYEFIVSGYRYMSLRLAGRLGYDPREIEDRMWELTKEKYAYVFNRLFDSYGVSYSDEELKELIAEYRNHPADLQFYPDGYPALKGLKDRGMLTGIISDGDPARQRNKIRSAIKGLPEPDTVSARILGGYGIGSERTESDNRLALLEEDEKKRETDYWFDEIILNDEFGGPQYRKPDPHGYREMARRLGIDPSEMIYVGDNPSKDFHIAAELPIRTARIIRENGIYNDREYLDGIRETWHLESLTDILDIADKTGGGMP